MKNINYLGPNIDGLKFQHGGQIQYECPSKTTAQELSRKFEPVFASWAKQFGAPAIVLTAPNGYTLQISADLADEDDIFFASTNAVYQSFQEGMVMSAVNTAISIDSVSNDTPQVAIANMLLPMPLLEKMQEIFSDSSKKICIFRRTDQVQVAVSQAVAEDIIGSTPLEAVQGRTRFDFWERRRLEDYLSQESKQLIPNDPGSEVVIKWQGYSPVTRDNWREWETKIFAIQIGATQYEVAETLEIRSIAKPVGAVQS